MFFSETRCINQAATTIWPCECWLTEALQSRLNAPEDVSVTTEGPTSLNRSYDTATAGGRRTRSAAATARAAERRRIRAASSTSSVPTADTEAADDAGQRTAAQDGSDQANNTLGMFSRYVPSLLRFK